MTAELDAIYEEARTLWRTKRYSEALQVLKRTENEKARFLYARMRCLSKMGHLDEALQYFNLLNRMYDDERIAVLAREIRDHASLSKEEVLEELAILCDYEEASWLFGKKRYAESLAALEEVDRRDQPEFVYAEARCLGKLGRFDEALATCARLEKKLHDKRGAALSEKLRAMLAGAGYLAVELPLLPTQDDALPAWDAPTIWDKFNLQKSSPTDAGHENKGVGTAEAGLELNPNALKVDVGPARMMKEGADHTLDGPSRLQDSLEGSSFPEETNADLALPETADSENIVPAPQQESEELAASLADSDAHDKPSGLALESLAPPREIVESQNTDFDAIEQPIDGPEMADAAPEHPSLLLDAGSEQNRAEETTYGLELAESRAECDRLKETVQIQESERETAARRIVELETVTVDLEHKLAELTADIEQSLRREESGRLKLDEVHAERDQFRGVVESQKTELQSSAQRIAELETVTAELERKLGELTADLEKSLNGKGVGKLELNEARAERDQFRIVVESQKAELQGSAQRIAELEATAVDIEHKLGELTANLEQSLSREETGQLSLDEARAERDQLRDAVEAQKAELQGSVQRIAELETVTAELERKLGELTANLEQSLSREEIGQLRLEEVRAERDQLRDAVEAQKAELQGSAQRIAELEATTVDMERKLGELTARYQQSQSEIESEKLKLDEACAERDQFRDVAKSQETELQASAQRNAELEATTVDMERKLAELTADLQQSRNERTSGALALDEVRAERDELRDAVKSQKAELQGFAERIAQFERVGAEFEQQVGTLETSLEQVRADLARSIQMADDLRTERDELMAIMGSQDVDLEGAAQQITEIKTVKADVERQLRGLAEEVENSRTRERAMAQALEEARSQQERLNAAIEQFKSDKMQIMQHMDDRERLVASLQKMVEVLTADIGQLRNQELASSQAIEALRTERDHFKTLLGQRDIVASCPVPVAEGKDMVAAALERQIMALAGDVAPLFAAVRSSLGILAREVAKIERDRMGNVIEATPNESRQAKRRRSLLSAIPPRSFLDDSIEPADFIDESQSHAGNEEASG